MEKTHWKKNNDSTYISGEDLQAELNGLKKDFPVTISSFKNGETYDQNEQKKITKTVLYFTNEAGVKLYKGVVLNNTNAKIFVSLSGSDYIDDWINLKVNMYAKVDTRHGFVVRFKKYQKPVLVTKRAEDILNSAADTESLVEAWKSLEPEERANGVISKLKNELKETLK